MRGLKAHQRKCRFIKGLNDELYSTVDNANEQEEELPDNLEELILESMPDLKPGVKLPNTDAQWKEADLFFRAELPISEIDESSVNKCVLKMTNTIYDFFANNFGTMKRANVSDEELHNRYANYTKQELKRALKDLKRNSPEDINSIRYVSKQLRNKVSSKVSPKQHFINHDAEIKNNLWRYTKLNLEAEDTPSPTFN